MQQLQAFSGHGLSLGPRLLLGYSLIISLPFPAKLLARQTLEITEILCVRKSFVKIFHNIWEKAIIMSIRFAVYFLHCGLWPVAFIRLCSFCN